MPFDSSGVYTPPNGSENAFPGQVIASATWNAIFTDIADAITALAQYSSVEFVIDGGGQPIQSGLGGYLEVPFAGTIVGVVLMADKVGTCVVDIWKDTYANYPPTVADTITASAKPTITATNKYKDTTLTGWTTSLAQRDILAFNLDSTSNIITKLTISLLIART